MIPTTLGWVWGQAGDSEGENKLNITILSGKGGTGKTTIALALSEPAKDVVKADCDVDVPNLYLFYQGRDIKKEYFYGGKKSVINKKFYIDCKKCEIVCQFDAIKDKSTM